VRNSATPNRSRFPILAASLSLVLLIAGGWWFLNGPGRSKSPTPPTAESTPANKPAPPKPADLKPTTRPAPASSPTTRPALVPTSLPTSLPTTHPTSAPTSAGDAPAATSSPSATSRPIGTASPAEPRVANTALDAARKLHASGKLLEARRQLNDLLKTTLPDSEAAEVRTLLARIADETVFSKKSFADDPLVETYVVQSGDGLEKIGKKYAVPYELLMTINGITNAASLRLDQKIKVPKGPFTARIYKSKFRMDLYLGDVFVRSYPVGLGTQGGTPTGTWKVKNRLLNPTYYPPASEGKKTIVAPDDPNNPLGDNWIGLEGVEGDAVGREGFGIHGTIEPDSIGKEASLGCVRMRNEDVAVVYQMLVTGKSTVIIAP